MCSIKPTFLLVLFVIALEFHGTYSQATCLPECRMLCQYGKVLDADGCKTCTCKPKQYHCSYRTLLEMLPATSTLSFDELKKWERKRHLTFVAFICQSVVLGMEYSLTFITLLLYLEEVIKTSHLSLFYSLISAAYLSAQVASSVILGRIVDKNRNVSRMFLIGNSLIVIGNIVYTVPYSAWNLFVGRLISGGGGCLRAIMTGELARSYPADDLSSKFSMMGMAFGLGFILGPGINFAFLKADFMVGPIHITYANAPGLYLSIIFVLMQVLASFLVSDLSKEYDLKEHDGARESQNALLELTACKNDAFNCEEESPLLSQHEELSAFEILYQILQHTDTLVIVMFSFSFMYCMVSFDLWQPMAVVNLMHWGVLEINIIIFGYGLSSVTILLLLSYRPLSDRTIVYFSWICTLSVMLIHIMYIFFKVCNSNHVLNIILWIFYAILFAIIVVMEEVFLIGVMAKMTSSPVQAFAESIRLAFSRSGALIALLTAAVAFPKLEYVCLFLAVLSYAGFLVLTWRRKSLQKPIILIK